MLKILVDTSVWWHWFTFKQNPDKLCSSRREHSENFETIYQLALSSTQVELLFNALVKHELPEKYSSEFSYYVLPIAKKIVIPLSRYDGLHRYDGSTLFGGTMGGSLKPFLTANNYQYENEITQEAEKLKADEKLYEKSPRKREKDVEHMESALEAGADLFITSDQRIINRLNDISNFYHSSHPINKIFVRTKTPTDALPDVKEYINA